LRILLRQSSDPSDALTQMNEVLVAEQGEELSPRYVSVAAAVLDTLSGEVQLTTAACEPAMVLRLHGATESFFAPGLPLGHESHARFETVRFKLNAGDTLLFVTDGLTEARHGKEFLEYEGVQRLAEQARAAPLADLGAAILSGAQAFAAGRLHDDACLLLVRMKAE
jgi:serine phosphatase RsbU (regulator of sigma subunit)